MADSKARGIAAILCAVALAGGVWFLLDAEAGSESAAPLAAVRIAETLPALATVPMPPPFEDRMVRKPDPREPVPSQTAAFCADANWTRMNVVVSQGEGGEFRVDAAAWRRTMTGSRAGIASWMSYCKRDGAAVRIVAADSDTLLATYDPVSGLRSY